MKLSPLQQYGIITANYWAFTLTDGALRMLVVFHFHQLGYSTLEIAFLFLFYEFFGVLTNLYGGWIGARYGLRLTLWAGTLLKWMDFYQCACQLLQTLLSLIRPRNPLLNALGHMFLAPGFGGTESMEVKGIFGGEVDCIGPKTSLGRPVSPPPTHPPGWSRVPCRALYRRPRTRTSSARG